VQRGKRHAEGFGLDWGGKEKIQEGSMIGKGWGKVSREPQEYAFQNKESELSRRDRLC